MIRLFAVAGILAWLLPASVMAAEVKGKPEILDAQTLIVDGKTLWLTDVHTPRPGDTCAFQDRKIDCGLVAKTGLQDLTAGVDVSCTILQPKSANVWNANCTAGGYNLSEGMIYTGWGRAAKTAPEKYQKIETNAKERKRGLWKGAFPATVNKAVEEG